MKNITVMSIFGTRPEAIKMGPVVKELEKRQETKSIVCVTAQHREMLDQVLQAFNITPDYDLDIMKHRQTLSDITVNALTGLEKVIKEVNPDIVLVHGDTTTTFAGALAAFYNKTKIGHVEAGLRTYDKYEPFPEEINRKLTGCMADIHFSPTELAKEHLLAENVNSDDIYLTGNTAIDALDYTINEGYKFEETELNDIDFDNNRVIAMTAHRRENLGEPLENICKAVRRIVEDNDDVEVVYAVHPNPIVQETAYKYLDGHSRIHLIKPIGITDMHNLMKKAYMVMTDSGGIQEEVPSLGKPVLVLRNVTERPEGVKAGTLKLVGSDQENIYKEALLLLNDEKEYKRMAEAKNPFGDGTASKQIVDIIIDKLG